MLCVSDEAAEAIILLITRGTQGSHRANAPEEAGILSLSAARCRIEDFLQTAWTGSYPERRERW